ncbi:MAG: hypothetical protein KAI22_12255, partial [Gammaproteobacteria bacterium]|nr:hypothetical protein [Gammaproteobacteria bacterium]
EKQNLTVNALLLVLLALFFLSGSLMWLQHGEYHHLQGMGWMGQSNSQSMTGPFFNDSAD